MHMARLLAQLSIFVMLIWIFCASLIRYASVRTKIKSKYEKNRAKKGRKVHSKEEHSRALAILNPYKPQEMRNYSAKCNMTSFFLA